MVVNDVQKDHQTTIVRDIDQGFQIVWRAVAAFGRERQNTVITPIAGAGKFGDRHQFDGGDAEIGEAG